jgi:hypothetical protein
MYSEMTVQEHEHTLVVCRLKPDSVSHKIWSVLAACTILDNFMCYLI